MTTCEYVPMTYGTRVRNVCSRRFFFFVFISVSLNTFTFLIWKQGKYNILCHGHRIHFRGALACTASTTISLFFILAYKYKRKKSKIHKALL